MTKTAMGPSPPLVPPAPPAVPRGTDPKLNEQGILAALANPDRFLTPNEMRSLMSFVLLACYDRKVAREFMAEMLDRVAMINITLSGLEGAARLHLEKQQEVAKPVLKPARGKKTACQAPTEVVIKSPEIQQLSKEFQASRKALADQFAKVTQCPTSEDTIS